VAGGGGYSLERSGVIDCVAKGYKDKRMYIQEALLESDCRGIGE